MQAERTRPAALRLPIPALGALLLGGAAAAGLLAQLDIKGVLVVAGVAVLAGGLLVVRDRPLFVLVLLVLTLQFLLHKKFGDWTKTVNSGAPLVYISSLYVWLGLLYVLWFFEGTLLSDLREGLRDRLVVLPLLAAVPAIFSLLPATDLQLASAELVRMACMYLLFLYVAVRVRRRRDLLGVLWSLLAIAAVQCAVAAVQWKTGSSLGLGFLGEQSVLDLRALDQGVTVPRPSGTVVHPDFLAALVAPIGLIAFSAGVRIERSPLKWACLAATPVAMLPLALAQTRAALLGAGVAFVLLVAANTLAGRIRPQVIMGSLAGVAFLVAIFWSKVDALVFQNVGTAHFQEEVTARTQLNDLALSMIADHPVLGVGINNFQQVMGGYDRYGLLFAGNPVHNLYLLVFAETGIFGLGLLLLLGFALLRAALRAARGADPLVAGVAGGIAATLVFFAVEEMLAFSLREEMPFALIAILAGLVVPLTRGRLAEAPADA